MLSKSSGPKSLCASFVQWCRLNATYTMNSHCLQLAAYLNKHETENITNNDLVMCLRISVHFFDFAGNFVAISHFQCVDKDHIAE